MGTQRGFRTQEPHEVLLPTAFPAALLLAHPSVRSCPSTERAQPNSYSFPQHRELA